MLKRKYLTGIFVSYLIIFVLDLYMPLSLPISVLITLLLLFFLFLSIFVEKFRLLREKRRVFLFLFATVLLLISLGYSRWFLSAKLTPAKLYADGKVHTISATVEKIRYEKSYGSAYVLEILCVDENPYTVGAVLEIPYADGLSVGDEIAFQSTIEEITDEFTYYHKSRGVLLSLYAENITFVDSEVRKPSVFETIREKIKKNFEIHIGGTEAGYATALFIGEKDALDGQTRLSYHRLGISHLLAVSGLHFSVIVGGFDLLLRTLTVPKRKKNMILILFSILFAGICGFSASVLRALIMFCMYYMADSIGEKSDSLTSLFFATVCIVSFQPFSVYDAGLWLSVFSTLGIVLTAPSMSRILSVKKEEKISLRMIKKIVRGFLCTVMMNVTALFFTMPVVYLLYGGFSLISPLSNLIFIPLTELILYLLIALTLFGGVPVVALFLGTVCKYLISFADEIAKNLSDLKGIYISIRYPFADWLLLFLIVFVLFVLFVGKFRVRKLFMGFALCTLVFGICFFVYERKTEDMTSLYLQTDGKSDVLGLIDDGEVLFVDISTGGRSVPTLAVDTLSEYYRSEIDTYLLTHLHTYHAGTLKALADEIKIHRILLPEAETEQDRCYIEDIQTSLNGSCEIELYKRDGSERVSVGDTVVTLPDYQTISRSSHPIVVLSAKTEDIGAWIYCGASAMELSEYQEALQGYRTVIFGSHGPNVKHIFDEACLSYAELVIFASEETAALVDTSVIRGDIMMPKNEVHIAFEH